MSVRDTGWDSGGQRTVGQFVLHAIQFDREFVRARVWFDHGDTLGQAAPTTKHPTQDAAKRAAEDALRTLCRDTLTALGD